MTVLQRDQALAEEIVGKYDRQKQHLIRENVQAIDYGLDFYAPQVFEHEGRHLLLGWMGMPDKDADYPSKEHGWMYSLTMPRELRLRQGHIYSRPARELRDLRVKESVIELERSMVSSLRQPLFAGSEILLTLEGTVTYTVGDTVYQVHKGEVLIVPPDTPHSLDMGENSSRYLFLFEPDAILSMRDIKSLAAHFHRIFHLRDGSEAHVRIRELLLRTHEAYEKQELMWNTICYSSILRMYAVLGQRYMSGIRQRSGDGSRSVDSEVITAAMTYINNHYQDDL